MMNIQEQHKSLRSQLLKMSKLSQRAVDYSIKAYELGRPEFCGEVHSTDQELQKLRHSISERGRIFLSADMPINAESRFACCALRICNSLHSTYTAAAAIAVTTMRGLERGGKIETSLICEMGQFVNSLVRLCAVALFNEEIQHARTVLQGDRGRRWFNLSLCHAQADLVQRTGAQAQFELTIVQNLGQIAEQSYDVAHAITVWLEGRDCPETTRERGPFLMRGTLAMPKSEQAGAA